MARTQNLLPEWNHLENRSPSHFLRAGSMAGQLESSPDDIRLGSRYARLPFVTILQDER